MDVAQKKVAQKLQVSSKKSDSLVSSTWWKKIGIYFTARIICLY
jgi:hypothetical protein